MKAKKAAQHRQAIAAAASLQTGLKPGTIPPLSSAPETTEFTKKSPPGGKTIPSNLNQSSTTLTPGKDVAILPDQSDDYEASKVNKMKKSQYDDDIKMVQDLDRWG